MKLAATHSLHNEFVITLITPKLFEGFNETFQKVAKRQKTLGQKLSRNFVGAKTFVLKTFSDQNI